MPTSSRQPKRRPQKQNPQPEVKQEAPKEEPMFILNHRGKLTFNRTIKAPRNG
jgi:hypothetical protein